MLLSLSDAESPQFRRPQRRSIRCNATLPESSGRRARAASSDRAGPNLATGARLTLTPHLVGRLVFPQRNSVNTKKNFPKLKFFF